MGKNWKLRSFVVSVSVVRNTSLYFTTATKTERKKKKKGGASKHFNDENKRETSTPDLWLLQNLRGQTQSLPVTSSPPFFWFGGWFWLLVVGFWFGVFFLKRYLLLALRHSTTPAGYKLWWARSTTLRAQNLFLI